MSTRCQVQVVQEGLGWPEAVTLYHHCDGYPSYMLPTIERAYAPDWEHGRARKVASFLCAVDPGQFEPEEGHELHGDIEYYYRLFVVNGTGGSMAEKPTWEVEVYVPRSFKEFWDQLTPEALECKIPRTDISALDISNLSD